MVWKTSCLQDSGGEHRVEEREGERERERDGVGGQLSYTILIEGYTLYSFC